MKKSGNALFIILIAVALFAALSYAITQSSRGGGGIEREQAQIAGAQLAQYGATMGSTIDRMQLVNGCSVTDFSFNFDSDGDGDVDNDAGDTYNNPTSPSDLSCHVFHPNGGAQDVSTIGANPSLTTTATDVEFYGSVRLLGWGSDVATVEGRDLVMILRNITERACTIINSEVGVTGIPGDSGDLNVAPFTGTYTTGDTIDGCVDFGGCADATTAPFGSIGSPSGCVREDSSGDYIYFHLMIAR